MKHKNLNQQLEEIARTHLGIDVFSKALVVDTHDITNRQIEKALKAAYLLGEKSGYKHGFGDAKEACDCELHEHLEDQKSPLDFFKQLV